MQVMNIAISMQGLQGINIVGDRKIKLGQYADDTTVFGVGNDDYVKLRRGIALFERASGMNVNWDKSLIIKLGIDFPLLDNDTNRCPWIRPRLGSTPPGNHHFFLKPIF